MSFKQVYLRRTETVGNDKCIYLSLRWSFPWTLSGCKEKLVSLGRYTDIILDNDRTNGLTNDRMWTQGSVKDQGRKSEHLLVSGGADIDAPRVTSRFEFACQSDVISKQAISWHSHPNNSSQHRAWMNAYPHLKKKKEKDILCFHLVWNYFNEKYC